MKLRLFFTALLSLTLSCVALVHAQKNTADSLYGTLLNAKNDTAICEAYEELGRYYYNASGNRINTALLYFNKGLTLATKINDKKRSAYFNRRLAKCYMFLDNQTRALAYSLQALSYFNTATKNQNILCELQEQIARIYFNKKSYALSRKHYIPLRNVAMQNKYEDYLNVANNQLALLNIEFNQIDSAIYYQNQNFIRDNKSRNEERLLFDYCNLSKCYLLKKQLNKCEELCNEGLLLAKKTQDSSFVDAELYTYLGGMYNQQERFIEAKAILHKVISKKMIFAEHLECIDAFKELATSYSNLRQYDSAYYYITKYYTISKSVYNQEENRRVNELNENYEIGTRESQIELLNKDNELNEAQIKKQQVIFYAIAAVLLMVVLLAFFIYRNLKTKQKANALLQQKNEEINQAHTLLEHKNELIHDSIVYAQHIQELLMPGDADLKEFSSEYFILYQPKDYVSGDIYWITKIDSHNIIVSAVDCTGHGVPGAMMSILAYDLLEYAVNEQQITEPAAILNCIKNRIKEKLKLAIEKDFSEGMDLALCKLNTTTNTLTYSGARNTILIVRNSEIIELNVDRQSMNVSTRNNFTQQTFIVQPNDMVYLYSDGYADQKGGPNNKKLYFSTFKKLLQQTAHLSCEAQHQHLSTFINEWMYNQTLQIDDMMIIGFRIN